MGVLDNVLLKKLQSRDTKKMDKKTVSFLYSWMKNTVIGPNLRL